MLVHPFAEWLVHFYEKSEMHTFGVTKKKTMYSIERKA